MRGEVSAGRGAAKPGFWLFLAVSALMLAGCETFDPDYNPSAIPLGMQLQTQAEGAESILDELPPGPAGDLAPPSYSPEELVAEIERERDRCARGDEYRDDYRDRYRRLRKQLLDGATAEANALREAGKDPYEDERIKYMHEALIRLPENPDCHKRVVGYQPEYGIGVTGELGGMKLGLPGYRYLGTEIGGTMNLRNGYNLEDDHTTNMLGAGGSYGIGKMFGGQARLEVGLRRFDAEISGARGAFDPGPGTTLLIPGTGDGPFGAGFSLPSAGGLNVVTTSDYGLDYNHTAFYGKVAADFWCDDEDDEEGYFDGFGFTPYVGLTYSRIRFDQRFAGAIPGYGIDFQYDTDVQNNAYGLMFGGQVMKPVPNTPVVLRAGLTGQVDFNDAKGSDSLDVTGFGSQTMSLKNTDTTLSYTLNAGVTVGAKSPIRFDLDLFHGQIGNTPVVTRDGAGPSRLNMEETDYLGGMLRTTFRF